jgi:hypothetical protein
MRCDNADLLGPGSQASSRAESLVDVEVDGHPRIMGRLIA